MNTLRDYVEWKLTHSDKIAEAEGYPLVLEKCKKNKQMKELKVWGYSEQPRKNLLDFTDIGFSSATMISVNRDIAEYRGHKSSSTDQYVASLGWLVFNSNRKTIKLIQGVPITISADVTPLERHDETRTTATKFSVITNETNASIFASHEFPMEIGIKSHLVYTFTPKSRFDESIRIILYLCSHTMRVENFQVEYGDADTEFVPYYISPENPIEVQSVGEKTKNLYDSKTYPPTNGQCIWNNGGVGQSSDMSATKHIPCSELRGKTITCGYGANYNPGIAFYDDDKVFISGKGYGDKSTITITVPENASYLRWCFMTDQKDQAMIVEGTTFGDYEPYGYKIPIVQRGKNLYNPDAITIISSWNISKNVSFTENSISTTVSGTNVTDGYLALKIGMASDYIGKEIGFTWNPVTSNIRLGYTTLCIYNSQNERVHEGSSSAWDGGRYSIVTVPKTVSETDVLGIRVYLAGGGTTQNGDAFEIKDIMIYEGTEPLPYEPYFEPLTHNIFLDEPLRKIGDYADYIDFKNETVFRTIKSMVLNGGEDIRKFTGATSAHMYNYITLGSYGYIVNDVCLCNQLSHQPKFSYSKEDIDAFRILNSSTGDARCVFRLYENREPVTEVDTLKLLLAQKYANGNPIIFYYALNTASVEPINCDIPTLTEKTTIFEVDTSLAPSNAYGKYVKR